MAYGYTFGNLISDLESEINQGLSGDTKTVTATEAKRWLNRGYYLVRRAVAQTGQDFFVKESTSDLEDGQSDYTLPDDFLQMYRLEIQPTSEATRFVAIEIKLNDLRVYQYNGSIDSPLYTLIGEEVRLFPTPSTDVTSGLRIWYYNAPITLVETTDVVYVPDGFEELLVVYAASKAKRKLGLNNEARALKEEFRIGIEEMKDAIKARGADRNTYVRDNESYY
jgi:hypothetical protein